MKNSDKSVYLNILQLIILIDGVSLQRVPESPCPQIVEYRSNNAGWYGIVNLPSSNYGSQITLQVKMSISAQLPTEYVGRLELLGNVNNAMHQASSGGSLQYKIHFPLTNPIPKITGIIVNGRNICSGPPATGDYVTSIDLESRIYNNVNTANTDSTNDNDNFNSNSYPSQPIYQKQRTTTEQSNDYSSNDNYQRFTTARSTTSNRYREPETSTNIRNNVDSSETFECGAPSRKTNALIIGGTETSPGDWPWLIAMFRKKVTGLNFICSGSLISNRHILTAAHCVKERDRSTVRPEDLVLKLGAYNIQDWTDTEAKIMNVKQVNVHPQFNSSNLYNDIAILSIDSVVFTEKCRPVCLWQKSNELSLVVGKTGSVVGWGRDDSGLTISPLPKLSRLPIVSTETCRASNPTFFVFTSENTFCAGNRDGTGPCNGDSGGGFYIYENNKWTIRGIVSSSLVNSDINENPCSLKDYVIFTDSAKYVSWIQYTITSS